MRKLVVSNFVSMDGYFEGKDRRIEPIWTYAHPDYADDARFDEYNVERLREADTIMISGGESFLGFKEYWQHRDQDSTVNAARHAYSRQLRFMRKLVVSDTLQPDQRGDWGNTEIVRLADANEMVRKLKAQDGGNIIIYAGRQMWQDFLRAKLLDELHLTMVPMVAGEGTRLFDFQPSAFFKLMSVKTWGDSGIVSMAYQVSYPSEAAPKR